MVKDYILNSLKEIIQVDGVDVEVIRSRRRKTISIKIVEARVSISVPYRLSKSRIEEVLFKKSRWIQKKLFEYSQREPVITKQYVSGEVFYFLGKKYSLRVHIGDEHLVQLDRNRGNLLITLPDQWNTSKRIRQCLAQWFYEQAEAVLREKVLHYSEIVGVQPSAVEVKTYKARWGSCTSLAKVQFNWKLIMAPHHIIDYVVVHELCHILEMNHSPRFWVQVEQVTPDYKACRQWLKENGASLEV